MPRPSEPLLTWLRGLMEQKKINTAQVAQSAGLTRARVRKILAGAEPMWVDELMKLSDALEVSPADMGLPDTPTAAPEAPPTPLPSAPQENTPSVDPWGNQPEQLFKIAFALGCDFLFLTRVDQLKDSGIPEAVLANYEGGDLPIKLDAAYHSYNAPKYHNEGVTITLSFDQIYDCTFPWAAIHQVTFFPAPPELAEEPPEDSEEASDASAAAPFLRLVT